MQEVEQCKEQLPGISSSLVENSTSKRHNFSGGITPVSPSPFQGEGRMGASLASVEWRYAVV